MSRTYFSVKRFSRNFCKQSIHSGDFKLDEHTEFFQDWNSIYGENLSSDNLAGKVEPTVVGSALFRSQKRRSTDVHDFHAAAQRNGDFTHGACAE